MATPENYIRRAAEMGLKTIGFANHVWDRCQPGASKWYEPQDMDHILKIKEQLPKDTLGVKVLVGCESEYCGGGKVGISREAAQQLDFVLLPMSHVHMKGFVLPEGVTALADIAKLMVQRFKEVVDLKIATGIAHPFFPVGYSDHVDEILGAISDAEYADCFGRAAEVGVSIEIQPGYFPEISGKTREGFHDDTFLRVMSIAKKSGCYFHFGSDSHSLTAIDKLQGLEKYMKDLGIGENDILPCLR